MQKSYSQSLIKISGLIFLLLLGVSFLTILVIKAEAASYITHLNPVNNPKISKPDYNPQNPLSAAYTDSTFGTTIVRVTGGPGDKVLYNGTTDSGQVWQRHTCQQYSSTDTAWNADSSLLMLDGCENKSMRLLDGNTFKVIRFRKDFVGGVPGAKVWSRTDPEVMYAIGGDSIYEFKPRANTVRTLYTFSGYSGFDTAGQGRKLSLDGSKLVVTAKRGGNTVVFGINVNTGQKSPDIPITFCSDGAIIAASGNYILVPKCGGGHEFNTYEYATGKLMYSHTKTVHMKHKDNMLINGRDYIVAPISGSATGFGVVRLDILTGATHSYLDVQDAYCNHLSARMYKDGRWVICTFDSGRQPMAYEIAAISVDGNSKNVVRRLAHHNSFRNTYSNEPHPNPSPDGKKIVFASNWGHVMGSNHNGPTNVYVILLPGWDTPGTAGGGGSTGGGGAPITGLCNLYNANSAIPTGYGVPWNIRVSSSPLLLSAHCQSNSVQLNVGTGDQNHYVYNQGYAYQNGAWQPFTLQGNLAQGSSAWLVGDGSYTLNNPPSGITYWVGYVCQWSPGLSQWHCGCRDSACTQNYWQLQGVVR